MTPERGLFLVLEGPEGSGKTTQAARLGEWLTSRGLRVLRVREPGGTDAGEEIRRLLLHRGHLPARAELLLMEAARAVLVEERIRPALAEGTIVLADRFALSSLAYQGEARGLGLEAVRELNAFATGGLDPDLTIVLAVSPDVSESRRSARGAADRIERAGREFHDRVARAYEMLAREEPGVVLLDGSAPPHAVHEQVVRLLQERFPETFASGAGYIGGGSGSGPDREDR